MYKSKHMILKIAYSLGAFVVFVLSAAAIFGSTEALNQEAMIPMSLREIAFSWLAIGAVPMALMSYLVYSLCYPY